jgi:succinyl-CoA synthetase alpha subunit
MSILINKDTRVAVQGITGNQGSFHTRIMLKEGTNIVAGVVPGKGGQEFEGIPIYNTVLEAKIFQDVEACIAFVPPKASTQSILESIDAGIKVIVNTADGIPVSDIIKIKLKLKNSDSWLFGPNTPGIITPHQCKLGFMPSNAYKPGSIGVISRSGSLSYEVCGELTKAELGQTSVIGIGGDRVPGTNFKDIIPLFEEDRDTKGIVILGEIGGVQEELAASIVKEICSKPVVAMIVGKSAPVGKSMGHGGAIITQGKGTYESKLQAFKYANVQVVNTPKELVKVLYNLLEK